MDPLIQSSTMRLVFVVFMVTANWLILATLTAVVSENMINAAKHQDSANTTPLKGETTRTTHYEPQNPQNPNVLGPGRLSWRVSERQLVTGTN
eukprot:1950120-Amphidinium_carterae.1